MNGDATPTESVPWPDWKSAAPADIWPAFFREHRPPVARVQGLIIRLHSDNQHDHVISVIESALISGQSQPWMYEVLALSMELAGRPREQIERVVLSLSDFGGADFSSMMFSAAYLTRFDRRAAALRLYREASKLAPEQPEPYLLGLPHARHLRDAAAVSWAACGTLSYGWTSDYASLHHDAENAALEAEQWARRAGDTALADSIKSSLEEALRRDVIIRLTWSGKGDLDMLVEEPTDTVCSFQERETSGGGVLTHDGYGPSQDNCFEEYICTYGRPGAYRIRVRHAWGDIVGRRATLVTTLDAGGPEPKTETRAVMLGDGDTIIDLSLTAGRRKDERTVSTLGISTDFDERRFARTGFLRDTAVRQAAAEEFQESRLQMARRAGAVGYQPVIEIIAEGAQVTAGAVVSADRRYVRLSMLPLFSNITDVIPFSFFGPTDGNGQ